MKTLVALNVQEKKTNDTVMCVDIIRHSFRIEIESWRSETKKVVFAAGHFKLKTRDRIVLLYESSAFMGSCRQCEIVAEFRLHNLFKSPEISFRNPSTKQ